MASACTQAAMTTPNPAHGEAGIVPTAMPTTSTSSHGSMTRRLAVEAGGLNIFWPAEDMMSILSVAWEEAKIEPLGEIKEERCGVA